MDNRIQLPQLLAAIVGTEVAGLLAGALTTRSIQEWYPMLKKPPFTPPTWVFGPVWTLLYALMGSALYLASTRQTADPGLVRLGQALYGVQLVLNVLWTLIFFGRRSLAGALVEIIVLWLAILLTALAFWRISRPAALLLVPYLAWSSFAALLTYALWRLNE
jgi:benzodiazapine receptor